VSRPGALRFQSGKTANYVGRGNREHIGKRKKKITNECKTQQVWGPSTGNERGANGKKGYGDKKKEEQV